MPYSDFTIEKLEKEFDLEVGEQKLFDTKRQIEPSAWLKSTLEKAERMGYSTEKERSERIISPILTELAENNQNSFFVFSGRNLEANIEKGLNGECDFLLAYSPTRFLLRSPIFSVVEAKKEAIDKGLEQCLAQMVGSQLFNQQHKQPEFNTIFGCSTTGDVWKFVKLQDKQIIFDTEEYYLNQISTLLSIMQQIVEVYKK